MKARQLILAALAATLVSAAGAEPDLPSAPMTSVFHIAKSENRNQVHYAVSVDAQCRPIGGRPVYGYWREYEEGPNVTDALKDSQQRAYGFSKPRSITRTEQGGDIRIAMRALPDRVLRIATFMQDGQCRARAFTPINGQPAVLTSIYVEIGFLYSIDYIMLRGVRIADGAKVQQRIED